MIDCVYINGLQQVGGCWFCSGYAFINEKDAKAQRKENEKTFCVSLVHHLNEEGKRVYCDGVIGKG